MTADDTNQPEEAESSPTIDQFGTSATADGLCEADLACGAGVGRSNTAASGAPDRGLGGTGGG